MMRAGFKVRVTSFEWHQLPQEGILTHLVWGKPPE